MLRVRSLALAAAGSVLGFSVNACDYCLISQGISPLDTVNGRGVRLTQRYTSLDSVFDGEDEITNPGAEETYYTTELSAFWSPIPRLTVLGVLPIRVTRVDGHLEHGHGHGEEEADHHDELTEDGDHHEATDLGPVVEDQHGGDEGLGDISLLFRFKAFEQHTLATTTTVALLGGVKVPSGTTDGHADNGDFLDAHAQLGTGSTDGLVGAALQHARGRWMLAANLLVAVKGEGEAGGIDYEYGNSANYDVNLRYRVQPAMVGAGAQQTFVSLGLVGEVRDTETLAGSELDGTGGHVVFIQPGLQQQWSPRVIFEVSAQVPVHHSVRGIQLSDDLKIIGSATMIF
jgi:Putative MetA-pathway of phenol degradation